MTADSTDAATAIKEVVSNCLNIRGYMDGKRTSPAKAGLYIKKYILLDHLFEDCQKAKFQVLILLLLL